MTYPAKLGQRYIAGVYSITTPSGNCYIGSSVNVKKRWRSHISDLRNGNHHAIRLQRAANKYGIDQLVFKFLLVCTRTDLLMYEQIIIDGYNPKYNTSLTAISPMHDPAIVKRVKEMNATPEQKQAASVRNSKNMNRESVKKKWRESISITHSDPAYKARISKIQSARRANPLLVEHYAKINTDPVYRASQSAKLTKCTPQRIHTGNTGRIALAWDDESA